MSFKKHSLIASFVTFTVLGFLFLGSFSTAHASTATQMKSFAASGGGCTTYSSPQGNASLAFAQYQSCIWGGNEFPDGLPFVASDAYFNFSAQSATLWTSCQVSISTVNISGSTIDGPQTFDCLNNARNNATGVHYVGNQRVYVNSGSGSLTKVCWYGVYSGHLYQGLNFFSPEQFV